MKVETTIEATREASGQLAPLALVPTMGALHAGHMALVDLARAHAPRVAVSIFVNPTQFGPNEDFHRYPRPLEADLAMCEAAGVDLVFAPPVDVMYPPGAPSIHVEPTAIARRLEGPRRPGHFAGVCQVVAKLFHIVQPHAAIFGQKDYQQLAVIRAMTAALDFPVEIVAAPTIRDADGLAMSSRNRYLSPAERMRALSIPRALNEAQISFAGGQTNVAKLEAAMRTTLSLAGDQVDVPVEIDYAEIVDAATLEPIETVDRPARALVAMRVGTTRLIDNAALDRRDVTAID